MASWDRFAVLDRQRLLAHVVPLHREGWYTISRPHAYNGRPQAFAMQHYDAGGPILLVQEHHDAIVRITAFTAYTVQRRALRRAFCGMDFFGEPVTCPAGDAFHPTDAQQITDVHVGDLYDIAISFHTPQEAVIFKLMVQGVYNS